MHIKKAVQRGDSTTSAGLAVGSEQGKSRDRQQCTKTHQCQSRDLQSDRVGNVCPALQDMPKPDTPEREELLETIERKRKHALPEEFRHTNPNYLKSALQGNKGVLKAYYLAYLYRCCEKEQSDIVPAAAEDKWVELVSWIHEVRQHTAKAAFRVDRAEMKKRRDDVFAFVKIIEDAI